VIFNFIFSPTKQLSKETVLYNFCSLKDCADGNNPFAGVVQATNGVFYGTTNFNGIATANGTLYSLSMGLAPFVLLRTAYGVVGAKVTIMGMGLTWFH